MLFLERSEIGNNMSVQIPGSKSESNRALILQALFNNINIENLSDSDDTRTLVNALSVGSSELNVGHAGTAMRFLTAYFAAREGAVVNLSGSPRMHQRPIGILVDALKQLGADIQYTANKGFPPLHIRGRRLAGGAVSVRADVSSQFISALMLIGPSLSNGLQISFPGTITSRPYIDMTAELLNRVGITVSLEDNAIYVPPVKSLPGRQHIVIEPDWSSASYYYSILSLSAPGSTILLQNFTRQSLQGDSRLVEIYKNFGVSTEFTSEGIILRRFDTAIPLCHLDLSATPDIAQTIAVTCLGLNVECKLTGLHTLRIKETDRLQALQNELRKFGADVQITDDSIHLKPPGQIRAEVAIDTYDDHRMAMAFAPLAVKTNISIGDPEVVSKSYPLFWEHLKSIGIRVRL